MFDECDIRLNQSRRCLVVTKYGPGIESTNVFQRGLNGFHGAIDRAADLFKLLKRYCPQMLINDGHGVANQLFSGSAAIDRLRQLCEMETQLIHQAIAQAAASDSGWIEQPDDFES